MRQMRVVLPEMEPARVPSQLTPCDQLLTLIYEINDICKLNNHQSKSVPLPEFFFCKKSYATPETVYIKKTKMWLKRKVSWRKFEFMYIKLVTGRFVLKSCYISLTFWVTCCIHGFLSNFILFKVKINFFLSKINIMF